LANQVGKHQSPYIIVTEKIIIAPLHNKKRETKSLLSH
jgi:hypothetical protein